MATDKKRLEQIVGLIGFLDAQLNNIEREQESQFVGLFRVSPQEDEYREFLGRLSGISNHDDMQAALEMESKDISIVCASKMLKAVINSLESPIIPLGFALEPFDAGSEKDKAVVGAVLAESLLQSIARTHPGEHCSAWAAAAAQLFALLCHTSRRPVTKMNEYALSVCFLPSLCGSRMSKPEDLAVEQKLLMGFQSSKRITDTPVLPTRLESFITYGRRIWGAVYDILPTLQAELNEMTRMQRGSIAGGAGRRRDMVFRFIERAAHPITGRLRGSDADLHHSISSTKSVGSSGTSVTGPAEGRRPSLITRALSQAVDRRTSKAHLVAAPPTSRLDATFIEGDSSLPAPARAPALSIAAGAPYNGSVRLLARMPSTPSTVTFASNSAITATPTSQQLARPSALPDKPLMQRRSSSTGSANGDVSATVKTAAQNSAIKRRMSRDGIVPPTPGALSRLNSNGTEDGSLRRSASQGRRVEFSPAKGESMLGSTRKTGSGRNMNPIDLDAPGVPGASRKERQPSLSDIGKQMIHAVSLETSRPSSGRFEEHDSDLL